jgi:septal ring factor EnvC (AmiA/AmiB activator)
MAKPPEKVDPELRIADLERELRFKDERISELKTEIDKDRELIRELEEHQQEGDEYLETFITTFGLVLNDDHEWTNDEDNKEHSALVDKYNDLLGRYNKLVDRFNRNIAKVNPVGRPIAASEAQQAQIIKHHKQGKSSRWIAEEMTLSRRTVTTVTGKLDGGDRTTARHRLRLDLEPKRKDWRDAARKRLPKGATAHFEKSRELVKEVKGLK